MPGQIKRNRLNVNDIKKPGTDFSEPGFSPMKRIFWRHLAAFSGICNTFVVHFICFPALQGALWRVVFRFCFTFHPMFPTVAIVIEPISGKTKYSVRLRVTYLRKARYFALRKLCAFEQWDKATMRFNKLYPDYKRENEMIQTYHQRAADILRGYERDRIQFTFERFERDMFGKNEGAQKTVASYAAEIAEMLKSQGNLGNSNLYLWLSVLLRKFSHKSIFQDVTLGWLRKLEHYMRTQRNLNDGGISAHLRTLRSVCNRAIADGFMPESWQPFKGFELNRLSKPARDKLAISLEEMSRFETVEGLTDKEQMYVDLFLFSFYCRGINMADIAELQKSNIKNGRLVYKRKKTGHGFDLKLIDRALAIINRYSSASPYLFPIYDGATISEDLRHKRRALITRLVNRSLKKTSAKIGLPPDIVFYTARHTYATALKQKGVSVEMISELLGHDSILTTRAYLKSFDVSALDIADDVLHGATAPHLPALRPE